MYIITNGLFARPLQFLKIPGALIYLILSKLSATERAKKRKWALQYMRYGDDVPDHSICILLLLVFSCVQPLVAAVSILYFCVNLTIAKYQLLYVYRELFQSGGLYWPVVRRSKHNRCSEQKMSSALILPWSDLLLSFRYTIA